MYCDTTTQDKNIIVLISLIQIDYLSQWRIQLILTFTTLNAYLFLIGWSILFFESAKWQLCMLMI